MSTRRDDPRTVLHWFDFICPFCYVGQQRNAILIRHGLHVVELSFQAHPDIPHGGIPAGPRVGPTYAMLEREATEAGLPLHWPRCIPNSRHALAAAEWVRQHHPNSFPQLHKELFAAHFALGEDLEDPEVIDRHAKASGVDLAALHAALADGSAAAALTEAQILGRKNGVQGTPAWLLDEQLIMGLRSRAEFERLAEHASSRFNDSHHFHGRELIPGTLPVPQDKNTIEASVTIRRPVEEVFAFYRDFKNLPSFLGDVMAVEQTGPATTRWTIQGPLGIQAHLDDKSDGGAHERADPIRKFTSTQNLLGNLLRSWILSWRDTGSRSDESAAWKTRTSGTGSDRKIPGSRSSGKSTPIEGDNGNGKGNRHQLFRRR